MNRIVRKTDQAHGVTFWRQDYQYRTPRYEVFRVIGYAPDTGLWYFRSMTEKNVIMKGNHQLGEGGFHPFLISPTKEQADAAI